PPISSLFPYTTLFRSKSGLFLFASARAFAFRKQLGQAKVKEFHLSSIGDKNIRGLDITVNDGLRVRCLQCIRHLVAILRHAFQRSEEHTSELQSPDHL